MVSGRNAGSQWPVWELSRISEETSSICSGDSIATVAGRRALVEVSNAGVGSQPFATVPVQL